MSGRSRTDVVLQRVVLVYSAVMASLVVAMLCAVLVSRF